MIESLALLSLEENYFESSYIGEYEFFLPIIPYVALVRTRNIGVLTSLSSFPLNFFRITRVLLDRCDHCDGNSVLVPPEI